MPRNRRAVPREERVAAIVEAASVRFVEHGYRGTSVSDVAADVGVKPAAVHWYFPTKDDLFAAVFERTIRVGFDVAGSVDSAVDSELELIAFLEDRAPYRGLHLDAHDRLTGSDRVGEVHDELHRWLDARMVDAVARRLPAGTDLSMVGDIGHIVLEGLLSTQKLDHPIDEVIRFTVDALVGAGASRGGVDPAVSRPADGS